MRQRLLLFAMMFATTIVAAGQGVTMHFTARTANGAWHQFDSVRIENLTHGWSVTTPDSVVTYGSSTQGIGEAGYGSSTELRVYPNPFAGRTEALLEQPAGGTVKIRVMRINGTVIAQRDERLDAGVYRIGITLSQPQVAFLCVESGGQTTVTKLVSCAGGGSDRLAVDWLTSVVDRGSATKDGDDFSIGDHVRCTAISYSGGARTESEPTTLYLAAENDITLVFSDGSMGGGDTASGGFDENGASLALFSVAEGRQVQFSRGNLQYTTTGSHATADGGTAVGTWRFAENQYDCISSGNANISSTYTGWIDLFGWGSSGWGGSSAVYYHPYDYLYRDEEGNLTGYQYGPLENSTLTDSYINADWAFYNAISNGGNHAGMWRTLTKEEWYYLIETRDNASSKYGDAVIADQYIGLVILPDRWTLPSGLSFTPGVNGSQWLSQSQNQYTMEQWSQMESAGAIFLPAAGYRIGIDAVYAGFQGAYWTSSSFVGGLNARSLSFRTGVGLDLHHRSYGLSVRPVRITNLTVTTAMVSDVTGTYVIAGGTVTDGGVSAPTRGICWSTSHNPTIADNHSYDGTGAGPFSHSITGLIPNTTYFFRAYAINSTDTAYGNEVTFTAHTCEQQLTGGFDENGASNALFSIANGRQVQFSRGNLQYTTTGSHATADGGTAVGTWRFAEHQYDCIGADNANASSTYAGWIDLFGPYKSGYNNGSDDYQPWSLSYPSEYPSCPENSDYGDLAFYNAISNGGNQAGIWHTLTQKEWLYLLWYRPNADRLRDLATIDGQYKGLVVLPDNWTMPAGLTFMGSRLNGGNSHPTFSDFYSNEYTLEQWQTMESAGAIFLPAAGCRNDRESEGEIGAVYGFGTSGIYMYKTGCSFGELYFYDWLLSYHPNFVVYGSVRPVRDATVVVVTHTVTNIAENSAIAGGTVTDCGSTSITMRGICWSTRRNPTISDSHTSDGAGTGSFSRCISGLSPNTTYFVRAYVTHGTGTTYGNEVTFTTAGNAPSIGGFNEYGASNALFSIDMEGLKKVRFSKGNLQYTTVGTHATADSGTAIGTWRFAEHQYEDLPKKDPDSITSTYSGWIDLFAWGTSGWNSGAEAYQPWTRDDYNGHYLNQHLTLNYANGDWAFYNAISNGGNQAGMWRELGRNEWDGLLRGRPDASSKYGIAMIDGQYRGLVILPDSWTLPTGLTFTPGSRYFNDETSNADYYYNDTLLFAADSLYSNQYTWDDWRKMECAGAIFLPFGSSGNDTHNNWSGYYWMNGLGQYLSFNALSVHNDREAMYLYGLCMVRPVLDANLTMPTNPTDTTSIPTDPTDPTDPQNPTTDSFDEDGASNAVFSVAEGRTVHFSRGNLQYQASTDTWRFAEHQYDCIGADNANISSTYSGWIDLFGWGTSGWNSGAICYQPWSTSRTGSDYHPGGSDTNNLSGSYANADWGVYNHISNGGNQAGMWRTLTKDEWNYLLFTRNASTVSGTENARYVKATIGSVTGLIVFPDSFTMPSGITVAASGINSRGAAFSDNTFTTQQWSQLEANGAVFLPAAGSRYGSSVLDVGTDGWTDGSYWSSSYYDWSYAYGVYFSSGNVFMVNNLRDVGFSVRLVKD